VTRINICETQAAATLLELSRLVDSEVAFSLASVVVYLNYFELGRAAALPLRRNENGFPSPFAVLIDKAMLALDESERLNGRFQFGVTRDVRKAENSCARGRIFENRLKILSGRGPKLMRSSVTALRSCCEAL